MAVAVQLGLNGYEQASDQHPRTLLRTCFVAATNVRLPACSSSALMSILYLLTAPPPPIEGTDAVSQGGDTQFRYVQSTAKGSVIKAADRKPAGPVTGELLAGGTYSLAAAATA